MLLTVNDLDYIVSQILKLDNIHTGKAIIDLPPWTLITSDRKVIGLYNDLVGEVEYSRFESQVINEAITTACIQKKDAISSQNDRIANYLKSGKSLTPISALKLFGCLSLSSRISDLRKSSLPIRTELIKLPKSGKRVARYFIIK